MQVRYRNTLEHLVALQKYVLLNTHLGKRMMLHRFIVMEAIIIAITIVFAINHNRLNVLIGFVVVSSLAWLLRARAVVVQFKKDFKRERRKDKTGQFDKDRLLSIAPEGATVRIGNEQTLYPWDHLVCAGRDRKYLYLITTGILHFVVPLSAFADEKEADTFLESIAAYRNAY